MWKSTKPNRTHRPIDFHRPHRLVAEIFIHRFHIATETPARSLGIDGTQVATLAISWHADQNAGAAGRFAQDARLLLGPGADQHKARSPAATSRSRDAAWMRRTRFLRFWKLATESRYGISSGSPRSARALARSAAVASRRTGRRRPCSDDKERDLGPVHQPLELRKGMVRHSGRTMAGGHVVE